MYINDSVNNRLSTVIFLLAIAMIFILHKGLGFKHHCGLIIERDLSKLKNFDC